MALEWKYCNELKQEQTYVNLKKVWSNTVVGIKRFFAGARLSRIALLFLVIFVIIYQITNHLFGALPSDSTPISVAPDNFYRLRDLKHVNELRRIKHSVSVELRELESKRNQIQDDISIQQTNLNSIEQTVKKAQNELEVLKRQLHQLKNEQREAAKPKMAAPARLVATKEDNVAMPPPAKYYRCRMHNCFDYSRCSLVSQFPIYVYAVNPGNNETATSPFSVTSYVSDATSSVFSSNPYVTSDPDSACLFVVVLGEVETKGGAIAPAPVDPQRVSQWLKSLSHWNGDGRNHLLVYLSKRSTTQNPLLGVDIGRALVAQSNFSPMQFRSDFDVVIPTFAVSGAGRGSVMSELEVDKVEEDIWVPWKESWADDEIALQVPAMRPFLLSFHGQWATAGDTNISPFEPEGQDPAVQEKAETEFHEILLDSLQKAQSSTIHGKFNIETKCAKERMITPGYSSEWALCGTFAMRAAVLSHSTFTLVPAPERHKSLSSSTLFVVRLTEALRSGAVPVIVGKHVDLPFAEFVDWEKAAIVLPQARITELTFFISNFPHADILSMRRHGRFLYNVYFSSPRAAIDSMLAVVRTRLQIPPLPIKDAVSNLIEHESYKVERREVAPGDALSEFGMPPPEGKIDSPEFTRNFTMVTLDARESWNTAPGPFHLFANLPKDRPLPTDAQFIGSPSGFRPIGDGTGGTGRVFQESLGGNSPQEQFTVVMLTYKREEVLIEAIQRLSNLPYLNKVVVVWNAPEPPRSDLRWPEIGVGVTVVHPEKNSLNNRFVPWDAIQTEAVLSIDDDAHLRHDEMLFGFRVWRQHRDRIVGFPGRVHTWDPRGSSWLYDSNHTCELSMVLTGAAFLHKYYMHLYTSWMPHEVRDIVDEYMNCEDIALNFLVSHLTRQPPVKVTSRWTFRCPGCPDALSQSQEHFNERHKCINKFVKIFGYVPLVFTQYRVDSVLFKTRVPHDKQKCFKFI